MAYMKFKELTKYFDFKTEILDISALPEYTREYVSEVEKMILFDRDALAVHYKKIHIVPYKSISTSAINYMRGKVELLFSLDSGYQLHINFIGTNHDQKENLKKIYQIMMNSVI